MPVISYWPEMGQQKPANTCGNVSYGWKDTYVLETPLELKGRGIRFVGVLNSERLTEQAQHKAGWREYYVTELALAKLKEHHSFARESLLD